MNTELAISYDPTSKAVCVTDAGAVVTERTMRGPSRAELEALADELADQFSGIERGRFLASLVSQIATWPEPLAPEAFYGPVGELVRLIEPHTEADPAALLVQSLIYFGNVIGRNSFYVADGAEHYTNIFGVLVGETSKGRKGTSRAHVERIFKGVDADWVDKRVLSGLSSGEGLIWAVRDPIEKLEQIKKNGKPTGETVRVIADHGESDKRLLVVESEFASVLQMLKREGNILSPLLRAAWDTGKLRTLTKNSPAKATGAHVSVVGHITREELRRLLTTTESGNGFANRFLWVCVRRSKCLPLGGEIHKVDFGPVARRLTDVVEFGRQSRKVTFDDEARKLWCDIYAALSEGRPGLLGAVTSRSEAQVVRLASIWALLDRSSLIRTEHLLAALALWEYCEDSARYVFGGSLGDPVADEIERALRGRPDGLTRTEISNLFGRHRKTAEIGSALDRLAAAGRAFARIEQTEGRSVERWFAGPAFPVAEGAKEANKAKEASI